MRRLAFISVVVAAACSSSYGTEEEPAPIGNDGGTNDASSDDANGSGDTGVVGDANAGGEAGTICATTDPFTSVEPVGLGGANVAVSDARLSLDEKYVIFKRHIIDAGPAVDASPAVAEIWSSMRSSPTAAFGPPTALGELAASYQIISPTISPNLLTVVYAQYVSGGSAWDLVAETRATPTSSFGSASLPNVNAGSNTSDFYPYLSHDGTILYFTSTRSGINSLFTVTFGTGETPAQIARLDKDPNDFAPVMSGDGLTLYFARSAPGELVNIASSSLVYVQHRGAAADQFGAATLVGEVNVASSRNLPTWISPDGCRLYLTSSRGGKLDIYVATRAPK